MENQKVGMREFRDKLATYLESDSPVTITRHGDTLGVYIPVRRKRTEEDWAALRAAQQVAQEALADAGMTEDEMIDDFKKWRLERRKNKSLAAAS